MLTSRISFLLQSSYVVEEIQELRRRGVTVIPCGACGDVTATDSELKAFAAETLYLQPLQIKRLLQAAFLCLLKFPLLKAFFRRALWQGKEPIARRLRTLMHTWLGAYYALLIESSEVKHIHVHHGYFASWIAMVAAHLLGIEFSMTLHGSDLLLHPAYLDIKLKYCKFCVTVSEFNRQHILGRYRDVQPEKVVVRRMGVDPGKHNRPAPPVARENSKLIMLTVGRLHSGQRPRVPSSSLPLAEEPRCPIRVPDRRRRARARVHRRASA